MEECGFPELREFALSLIRFYAGCAGIYQNENIDTVISRIKQYDKYYEMGIPIYKNDVKIFICDNMGKYYNTCSYSSFRYFIDNLNPHDFADYVMNEFHVNVRKYIKYLELIQNRT